MRWSRLSPQTLLDLSPAMYNELVELMADEHRAIERAKRKT